jgi:tetratricopeptide (TPR) repeat protein
MRRKARGVALRMTVALFLLAGSAISAGAGDDSLRQEVLGLGDISGDDALRGRLLSLLEKPDHAKKLIAAGRAILKAKDHQLAYNSAYLLAQTAGERKDFKSSEAFYRVCMDQAVKLHSTHKVLQSYGGLIDVYYDNKKYAECARVCQELIELKTDDGKPRAYYIAVTNRFGQADFVEDEAYDVARPLRPGVYRLLIQTTAKQGKFDKALKLADNQLRATDHWMNRELKGWVLREAGQYAEAAKTYEDVLDRVTKDKTLEENERERYQERTRYVLSSVYVDLKQIDRATEHLQALLAKKPDHPGYNNDLGYIWADNDRNLDEAEKLIRKALELDRKRRQANPKLKPDDDRDNGAYLDSLGWVLFKKKQYKEAKDILLKAIEDKNAQHIEIYDHLGDVHLMLGERELAMKVWQRGLELAGESRREQERKSEVEKKLEKLKQ